MNFTTYKLFDSIDQLNEYLIIQNKIEDINILEQKIKNNLLFFTCKQNVKIFKKCRYPELYFTCWDNEILIGYLKILCLNNYNNLNEYFRTLIAISVHNKYKGNGISKQLLKNYFEYCEENNINDILYISPWTRSRI